MTRYYATGFRLTLMSVDGNKSLRIGTLAKEAGVGIETVRFYERRGLLPKPPRTARGYRIYPTEAVRRLRFIKRAQETGFSLKEIGVLLMLRLSPRGTSAQVRRRTYAKIEDIVAKIRTLKSMKRTLQNLTKACPGYGPASECPILETLDGEKP